MWPWIRRLESIADVLIAGALFFVALALAGTVFAIIVAAIYGDLPCN